MNLILSILCSVMLLHTSLQPQSATVVVVVGAEGTEEYGRMFREWSGRWESASKQAGARFVAVGLDAAGSATDHDHLKQLLAEHTKPSQEPMWLILIGHGTFDGKVARFNLRGPDVSLP